MVRDTPLNMCQAHLACWGTLCCTWLTWNTTGASAPNFFEEYGLWKDAPILTGTTKFEPLPDVKNIMITGGSGFM